MERVKVDLSGVCQVDLEPKLNARNILMMVSPLAENKRVRKYRTDEEEVDIEEIEEAEAAEDDHDDLNPEDQYDEEGELVDGENVERVLLAVEEVVERGRGALDELPANTARGLDKRALVGRGGL